MQEKGIGQERLGKERTGKEKWKQQTGGDSSE